MACTYTAGPEDCFSWSPPSRASSFCAFGSEPRSVPPLKSSLAASCRSWLSPSAACSGLLFVRLVDIGVSPDQQRAGCSNEKQTRNNNAHEDLQIIPTRYATPLRSRGQIVKARLEGETVPTPFSVPSINGRDGAFRSADGGEIIVEMTSLILW